MASTTASTAVKSALHTPDQPSVYISGIILTFFLQRLRYDRTNVASEIRSLEHLDAQIWQDLAHDLGSVAELEVCVLRNPVSHSHPMCITASFFPISVEFSFHLHTARVSPMFPSIPPCATGLGINYPVQVYIYAPTRVDGSHFSAQ